MQQTSLPRFGLNPLARRSLSSVKTFVAYADGSNDNNHPNHIAFEAIKPVEKDGKLVCRVCGGELSTRADDQDEAAINKRHDIYYNDKDGTMAAVNYFKKKGGAKVISVDGSVPIKEVTALILKELA